MKNWLILTIIFCASCSSNKVFQNKSDLPQKPAQFSFEIFKLDPAPLLFGGDGKLRLGGFSGLYFESFNKNK